MLRKQQPWNLQNLQEAMPRFVLQLTGFGSSKFPEGCRVVCTRVWFWSVVNQGEFCWGCQGLLLSGYYGKGHVFLFLHNTCIAHWLARCAMFWFSLRGLCCLWKQPKSHELTWFPRFSGWIVYATVFHQQENTITKCKQRLKTPTIWITVQGTAGEEQECSVVSATPQTFPLPN